MYARDKELIAPPDALPLVYIRGHSSNRTQHVHLLLPSSGERCWGELHTCRANMEGMDIAHSLWRSGGGAVKAQSQGTDV